MFSKKILLNPKENEDKPPPGLSSDGYFKRLAMINPGVINHGGGNITLFPRMIYQDSKGINSAILKQKAVLEGDNIRLIGEEETIFNPRPNDVHSNRGYEDKRVVKIDGETPYHSFVVCHDGLNARTEYHRTSTDNPENLSDWHDFGIFFPNISGEEAISRVNDPLYKRWWTEEHNRERVVEVKKTLRDKGIPPPEEHYLSTKDVCAWPRKVSNGNGSKEYYAVIVRFKPHMQIIYLEDWNQLAKKEFWEETISNLDRHTLIEAEDPTRGWVGLAGAPFELKEGLIIPYHTGTMVPERVYTGEGALVDPKNPQKIIAKTHRPLLEAIEPWEQNGLVSGKVVFPTGHILSDDGKTIYDIYGAGDLFTAYIPMKTSDLLERMKPV